MAVIASILLALGLAVSLFVNDTLTYLHGSWFALYFASCVIVYEKHKAPWPVLLWLGAVFFSAFLFHPVFQSFTWAAALTASPVIALSFRNRLREVTIAAGAALVLYAFNLIAQHFWVSGTLGVYFEFLYGNRSAWPLYDPNAAAATMNVGLICSLGIYLRKRKLRYAVLAGIFAFALYCTMSRGGFLCAGVGLSVMTAVMFRHWRPYIAMAGAASVTGAFLIPGGRR